MAWLRCQLHGCCVNGCSSSEIVAQHVDVDGCSVFVRCCNIWCGKWCVAANVNLNLSSCAKRRRDRCIAELVRQRSNAGEAGCSGEQHMVGSSQRCSAHCSSWCSSDGQRDQSTNTSLVVGQNVNVDGLCISNLSRISKSNRRIGQHVNQHSGRAELANRVGDGVCERIGSVIQPSWSVGDVAAGEAGAGCSV